VAQALLSAAAKRDVGPHALAHLGAGDEVHEHLAAQAGLARLARYRDLDFTAEVRPLRRRPEVRRAGRRDRMIRVIGVVVPAHDEQDLLPSCLASLRRAARALRGAGSRHT
jgi:hypothetical protein